MTAAPTHDEWIAAQETRPIRVDGHDLTVAYRDEGAGDPPVVFLHGIPSWSFLWRRIAPAIAADRRTVVPDLLGYGSSSMRDGFDRSIRAQELMLDALLDALEIDDVVLVAHDIGGGVALRYAARHPDRVTKLVVSNATCYDSWPVEFVIDLGRPATASMPGDEFEQTIVPAFARGVYADEADPAFVEGITAPWLTDEGQVSLCRNAAATNTNHTTEIDYGAIEADLLCLWGADDVMQPVEYAERLADDVGGDVVELDRAYHWVVEDRPEAYVEELRSFLAA